MADTVGGLQVTIQIPDQAVADIGFMMDASDEEAAAGACERFAALAFRLFYDWITGAKRYRSLTEQYIEWVANIYTELLPPEESPNVFRLYNKFNIPHGQATYICRVLNERALAHWRERAVAELRIALEEKREKAQGFVDKAEPERMMVVKVSNLASLELRNITNTLFSVDHSILPPTVSSSYGEIRSVSVPAQTLLRVLTHFEEQE